MSFADRRERGDQWAEKVKQLIQQHGWQIVPMGAENVASSIHSRLSEMKNPDPTARFVRFMPDGFAVHPVEETAFFYDAKAGKSIEKDAYLAYMAFRGENRRVILFINAGGVMYRVSVQKLLFLDSVKYVGGFPPERQMPVDDEGWIAPRLWPKAKYLRWKVSKPEGSGTPYRYLDLPAMAEYRWQPKSSTEDATF